MYTANTEMDMERVTHLLDNLEQDLRDLRQILGTDAQYAQQESAYFQAQNGSEQGIEGVFDGERMIDYSGKSYQVSANYASKSKLVEGDPLKLYITPDGKFFYKQLGPVERKTVPGVLRAEGNQYVVDAEDGNTYKILTASVTYYMSLFNVRPGDKVLIMIPAEQPAHWAVIDNVL
ncbi:hypothetical protein KGQ71_02630 [Patescibacteria group bacterium]|nr:hypothetical protein [Patescibacteria group bacterium]